MSSWAQRSISWTITDILVKLSSASEGIFDKAFGFIDLTSSKTINKFILHFRPLLIGLLALSVFYLGLMLIMKHEKKPDLGINIAIFVLCICCSTLVFGELNGLAKSFKSGVSGFGKKTSKDIETYKVVDNNLIDLVHLSTKFKGLEHVDYSNKKAKPKYYGAGITNKSKFDLIDYTEVLNPNSDVYKYENEGKSKDLLSKKLIIGEWTNNEYMSRNLYNGFGWNSSDDADMGNEFYYRYYFDSINAWLQLGALVLIFLTMSYKCIRITFELVVGRLFTYLYSTEISGGEKIKKILVFIRDSYILLGVCVISIKLYSIITAYVSSHYTGLVQGIFSLFIAFAVIDGPNLVEKLLGMDAGLKSSVMRGVAMANAGLGVARGIKGGLKAGAKAGAFAGKGVKYGFNKAKELGKESGNAAENLSKMEGAKDINDKKDNKSGDKDSNKKRDASFMDDASINSKKENKVDAFNKEAENTFNKNDEEAGSSVKSSILDNNDTRDRSLSREAGKELNKAGDKFNRNKNGFMENHNKNKMKNSGGLDRHISRSKKVNLDSKLKENHKVSKGTGVKSNFLDKKNKEG
mgnify:CR=1 FL=1